MGDFHTTSMCRFMVATQAALWPLATAPAATRHRRMHPVRSLSGGCREFPLGGCHCGLCRSDDWSERRGKTAPRTEGICFFPKYDCRHGIRLPGHRVALRR